MGSRYLKINDIFESYLNHLIRDCNLLYEDLKDDNTIKNLATLIEMTMNEIYSKNEVFKTKSQYIDAVKESIKNRFFYKQPIYNTQDLDDIDKTLKIIDSHPSHQQRSQEWYQFRWERLTASDLAKAVGEKGDKSRLELLYQKSITLENYIKQRESFSLGGQAAIQHGICFEPVATALYEWKNKLEVKEYGCLPHLYINYLAASPDGICISREKNPNYHGRMLEIKCPYSRTITGIPKVEYYMQVQLQLEVCDLEYCDFLECDIRTYSGMRDFLDDSPKNNNGEDQISYCFNSSGKRKGVLYEYTEKGSNTLKYKYCPLDFTNDQVSQWIRDTKEEIISNPNFCPVGCRYWWLEEYNTTLIKREPQYFDGLKTKLNDFWSLVLHYRKNGLEELEIKLGMKPKPPTQLQMMLEKNDNLEEIYYHQVEKENTKIKDHETVDFIDIESSDSDGDEHQEKVLPKKIVKKNILVIKPDDED